MILKALVKTLLVIYGFSTMSFAIMDVSHRILHGIKNEFHSHEHESHHTIGDHHVSLQAEVSHQTDSDPASPVHSYFLFFENCNAIVINFSAAVTHYLEGSFPLSSFYAAPLVPPPLP